LKVEKNKLSKYVKIIKVSGPLVVADNMAGAKMYELVKNLNLKIENVWEDKHDITYICNDKTKFHINRWM